MIIVPLGLFFFYVKSKSMFSSSLRYAALEDSWKDPGLVISPKFENPYRTEPLVTLDGDRRDIAHKYLVDLYGERGVIGLVHLMEENMVRDIQALHSKQRVSRETEHRPSGFTLGVDELLLALAAVLLFMYVSQE